MFFIPLGVASLVAAAAIWLTAQLKGGSTAAVRIGETVLTGPMLYAIAVILAVAGVLFIVSAVMRTIRRVAATVATLTLLTGGGVGAAVSQNLSDFKAEHCPQATSLSVNECFKG